MGCPIALVGGQHGQRQPRMAPPELGDRDCHRHLAPSTFGVGCGDDRRGSREGAAVGVCESSGSDVIGRDPRRGDVLRASSSGCACGTDSQAQRPFRATGKATTVDVSPAATFSVDAATAVVAGEPGAVTVSGKVDGHAGGVRGTLPAEVADVPVDSVASGVLVEFRSTKVAAPVKVVFDDVPVDTAAVVVHVSDTGKWECRSSNA